MRPVTRYEADDGSIHTTEEEALKRDELIARCAAIERRLGMKERPDGTGFPNGEGYLQHPPGTRDSLVGWLRSEGVHRDGRGPLGKLLYRAWCMDEDDREWGQPYFAINPSQGKQEEWSE